MNIKKPQRLSLAKQILIELERCISDGVWPLGAKIPSEPELTAMFAVSRNTVREALQSLIHAGLLQARPGDGTYVIARTRLEVIIHKQLQSSELSKIIEARLALEREIARLAAVNRTAEDLKRLDLLLAARNRSGSGDDDVRFHAAVAQATGNGILAGFYDVICRYMQQHMPQKLAPSQTPESECLLHDELFAAITAREPDRAEDITCEIINFYSLRQLSDTTQL